MISGVKKLKMYNLNTIKYAQIAISWPIIGQRAKWVPLTSPYFVFIKANVHHSVLWSKKFWAAHPIGKCSYPL